MESLSLEEENIIKSMKNLFRQKKSFFTNLLRNLFGQEKETKAIKFRILRDIKNLFELEKKEKNYCKPVRVSNFWHNN